MEALMRRVLLFNILADNFNWSTATTTCKITYHNAPPHNFLVTLGYCCLILRLKTPFRLFTSLEILTFGG